LPLPKKGWIPFCWTKVLIITINKAIEKATQVNETELAAVAKEGMPDIPGMDALLGK
jgi:hypothetical protein